MVKNVDPNIECIITQDIEMTSDVNHADVAFACNSWMEFTYPEMTMTVSNPWVQIWKGGIRRGSRSKSRSTFGRPNA
jgi:nitrate reductase alpha subunit